MSKGFLSFRKWPKDGCYPSGSIECHKTESMIWMSHDSVEWGWGKNHRNLWARILQIDKTQSDEQQPPERLFVAYKQNFGKKFSATATNHLHNEENSLLLAILTCSMETDHSNHIQACPFLKARSFNLGFLQIRIHRCGDPWQNNKRFQVEQVVWKTWSLKV